jgi:hypothetical protein
MNTFLPFHEKLKFLWKISNEICILQIGIHTTNMEKSKAANNEKNIGSWKN